MLFKETTEDDKRREVTGTVKTEWVSNQRTKLKHKHTKKNGSLGTSTSLRSVSRGIVVKLAWDEGAGSFMSRKSNLQGFREHAPFSGTNCKMTKDRGV